MAPRCLVVSHDLVGPAMAGPGIRYREMARALGRAGVDARLAVPPGSAETDPGLEIVPYTPRDWPTLAAAATWAETIVVTGSLLADFPPLVAPDRALVVDLYDPFIVENLHREMDNRAADPAGVAYRFGCYLEVLHGLLRRADLVLCAGERQRAFYRGALAAVGRGGPTAPPVALVPFGLPTDPPPPRARAMKGVHPAIGPDDPVVLWHGGIWDWFDPLTAIRAIDRARRDVPDLRLVFLGARHPNPAVGAMRAAGAAAALVAELALERHVVFNDWTPYDARADFLAEANLGISLHADSYETRLAYRTRMVDAVWANLPVVANPGDELNESLAGAGVAYLEPIGDAGAVARRIVALLGRPDLKRELAPRFAGLAAAMTWDRAIAPLAAFCRAPRRAA